MRRSKALDETILRHPLNFPNEITCQVKVRSKFKIGVFRLRAVETSKLSVLGQNLLRELLKYRARHWLSECLILTFALLGGVFEHPPLRFFADSKKTAARSAAGFSPTLSPIFLATFVKVSILGHARSGHQVRSSDHTLQKLYNRAPATVFEGKLWNFRNMIRSSVPTKCISWIFDIDDLRSGHFRDLPIISQWAKNKLPVLCFILSLYEWNRIR